ncbi:MAG: phosphatidylglycerol lysyltransferase domain-containing protein [Mycoplasmoidaceae bacterium]
MDSLKNITWKQLDWNSYKNVDILLKNLDNEPFSALTYLEWKYYGVDIKYALYNGSILFIGEITNKHKNIIKDSDVNNIIKDFQIKNTILRPFFLKDSIQDIIKICKAEINSKENIILENFYEEDLVNISPKKHLWEWDSNYIYETEKLKFFKGKSLQKKRNLLNYFVLNYKANSSIEKLTKNNINVILEFIEKPNEEIEFIEAEVLFYIDLLKNFDEQTMSGSILYLDNKLIGFTLGYLRNNYYEIYIEKAFKSIKGSFQYLLSQNLIINNINTSFVDRQDGASSEGIIKSKLSYKPIKICKRSVYLI